MMAKRYELGEFFELRIRAYSSAIHGSILLWLTLVGLSIAFLDYSLATAVLAGTIATLLHWDSEMWHQLGHAWAAKKTGYPMKGITAWWIFAASRYPRDEPELSAEIHIRRALGGPLASSLVSLVAGLVAVALKPAGGLISMLTLFWFFDNLVVFTIGSLIPLGFNDGSTLLHWWPRRERKDQP